MAKVIKIIGSGGYDGLMDFPDLVVDLQEPLEFVEGTNLYGIPITQLAEACHLSRDDLAWLLYNCGDIGYDEEMITFFTHEFEVIE